MATPLASGRVLIPRQTVDGTDECPECGTMSPWVQRKLWCVHCLCVHEVDASVSSTLEFRPMRRLEGKMVIGNA